MKHNYIFFSVVTLIFTLMIPEPISSQSWIIVGRNNDNPDGYSIVCTQAVTSADIVLITEDEYDSAFNTFPSPTESLVQYTPPAGGHVAGEVISIAETGASTNIVAVVGCSSGTCGTAVNIGGTFAIGTSNDQLYTVKDADADITNGVDEIYSVWFWNGSEGSGQDPTIDYPNCIKLTIPGDISYVDYMASLRSMDANAPDLEDINNYSVAASNMPLSLVPFTAGILPVNITLLRAYKQINKVAVEWITDLEVNNDFFEVERSADGKEFRSIGSVRGNGNKNTHSFYSFEDYNPLNGMNYYRLKQVDFDGIYEYSDVVSVDYDSTVRSLTISPNPVTNWTELNIEKSFNTDMDFKIYNAMGQVMFSGTLLQDQLKKSLDLSELSPGTYTLKMGQGEYAIVERIVKM
jgi:hypothetical protein